MQVVGTEKLHDFKNQYADVRKQIDAWLCDVEEAQWNNTQDIKKHYATASFLSGNRIIFNLKGKDYRLLVKVNYTTQVVLILKIDTHAEYNKWQL